MGSPGVFGRLFFTLTWDGLRISQAEIQPRLVIRKHGTVLHLMWSAGEEFVAEKSDTPGGPWTIDSSSNISDFDENGIASIWMNAPMQNTFFRLMRQ